jgi:riboflavin biosynthesis pyrimidine reductase
VGELIYTAIQSLDGYIADEQGDFEWAAPGEEVHAFVNELTRMVIGGPGLAASAFRAGLVDELQLFIAPAIVGGGTSSLPAGVRLELELVEEGRFDGGMAYLRYRTR